MVLLGRVALYLLFASVAGFTVLSAVSAPLANPNTAERGTLPAGTAVVAVLVGAAFVVGLASVVWYTANGDRWSRRAR